MKSINYLAALALPVMFAACANEEIVVDTPQEMQEVVGAKLLGTDITLKVSGSDAQSRFADGKAGWEAADKLGLGWVLTTKTPDLDQTLGAKINNNKVWANNLFETADEGKTFSTKGNIYEGYQFAYYPFAYTAKVAEMVVELNPVQTAGYTSADEAKDQNAAWAKINSQRFNMSALQFLTNGEEVKNNQLEAEFELLSPFNRIAVRPVAEEGSPFATGGKLAEYPINSLSITAGTSEVFASTATVNFKNLHKVEDGADNTVALLESFKNSFTVTRTANSQREFAEGLYKVSDNEPRLIMFAYPMSGATVVDAKKVKIEIATDGGKFEIGWRTPEAGEPDFVEGDAEYTNNAALTALAAAYAEGGYMTTFDQIGNLRLSVVLNKDYFKPDFGAIESIEQWNECVKLANDLELTDAQFKLKTGANFDLKSTLKVPANGVTVTGTSGNDFNVVGNKVTWPANLKIAGKLNITVKKDGKLTVKKNADLSNATKLTNEGTIVVEAGATIGKQDGSTLDNSKGVIDVAWGGFVYPAAGKENVITYTLKLEKGKVNLSKVMDMVSTSLKYSASVNTLVVGDGITLNCVEDYIIEGEEGSNNPYNPSEGTEDKPAQNILDLTNINLQINGTGAVVAPANYAHKAKAVQMNGGSIENVNIEGDLKIIGGENTVIIENVGSLTAEGGTTTLTDVLVSGTATVAEGATLAWSNATINSELTNDGTINLTGVAKIGGQFINNGTLTTDSDMTVESLVLNTGSVTTLKKDSEEKTIWYTNTYEKKGGTLTGAVLSTSSSEFNTKLAELITKGGGEIVANCDVELNKIPELAKGTITIKGASKDTKLFINVTDSKPLEFNSSVNFENITVVAETNFDDHDGYGYDEEMILITKDNSTFKNVVFKTTVAVAANATFENCTFNVDGEKPYAMWVATINKTVDVKDCTINMARGIKVQRGFKDKFENYAQNDGTKAVLNVSGTTFITTAKSAVLADGQVKVVWGEGNDITQVKADKTNAVWVDEAYNKDDVKNAAKVVVEGCTKKIEGK